MRCSVGIAEDVGPDFDPDNAETWLRRAREVDVRIDESWALLRQAQESGRFNPRQRDRREHVHELEAVLHLLEQAVAETQSMVRTIAISADQARYWDEDFRSRWCAMLAEHGRGRRRRGRRATRELRTELQRLADDMSTDELAGDQWHEYGGLIVNLRNVIDAVSRVAAPEPLAAADAEPVAGAAAQDRSVGWPHPYGRRTHEDPAHCREPRPQRGRPRRRPRRPTWLPGDGPAPASLGGYAGLYMELVTATPSCPAFRLTSRHTGLADDATPEHVERLWILEVEGGRIVVEASHEPGATEEQIAQLTQPVGRSGSQNTN